MKAGRGEAVTSANHKEPIPMTQADSVHSTPPTNTPTRRCFLSTTATLAVGGASLGLAIPPAAAVESDPIFAMIERHRELSGQCRAAYDISGKLLDGPELDAAEAVSVEKHDRLIDHADALVGCEPTTMAGVLAAMRYLATLPDWQEPSDGEWISGDGASMDWHQAFLDTLANAIESIADGGGRRDASHGKNRGRPGGHRERHTLSPCHQHGGPDNHYPQSSIRAVPAL
jgi:hypothetical protein